MHIDLLILVISLGNKDVQVAMKQCQGLKNLCDIKPNCNAKVHERALIIQELHNNVKRNRDLYIVPEY